MSRLSVYSASCHNLSICHVYLQIVKDGQKWACRSCITGHRSSKCTHADRDLFPIAKKGRPSSHCKVCREAGIPSSSDEPPPPGCTCQAKRKARSSIPSIPGSISPDDVLPNEPSAAKAANRARDKRRKASQDDGASTGMAASASGPSDICKPSKAFDNHGLWLKRRWLSIKFLAGAKRTRVFVLTLSSKRIVSSANTTGTSAPTPAQRIFFHGSTSLCVIQQPSIRLAASATEDRFCRHLG